jgi:alkylhydroperoxidase/carboxymuconolactone decarboxylase family protein YurZ
MTDDDPLATVSDIHAKRGYLLPHHGLMAISTPHLLERYDSLYSTLTLTERHLSRHAHEFVWLGVLISCEESLGSHHVKRFVDAGGDAEDLGLVTAISAMAKGSEGYLFVEDHWVPHLPTARPREQYLAAFEQVIGPIAPTLAHMTACAVHTCSGNWRSLKWQIEAAYHAGVNELELAEALSLAMFPGSVPYYVRAAEVWRQLIVDNGVPASDLFKQWAKISGQGGYDEASGVKE